MGLPDTCDLWHIYILVTSHKCPKNCHACPIIKEGSTFQSSNTKKIHSIRKYLTCDSSFIVYLGTCSRCRGQYIGKSTRPFKRRHSGHKQEIKNRIGGLGHHYGGENGCGYKNLTIQVIDQVEQGDHQALSDLELYWQHQLRCFVENGANGHCYKKEFTWVWLGSAFQVKNLWRLWWILCAVCFFLVWKTWSIIVIFQICLVVNWSWRWFVN